MSSIQRVAVLGAGVMGTGIATHLANAGIESLLYDLDQKMAAGGIKAALKSRPAALFRKDNAALITPCTYDDDADKLASCDWIVEVVVERLDIKQKVFRWVADNRREGSIVSSNTSGIKLADMAADMSEEMRRNFLVTHFFNPVRYMKLLEIVAGKDTDPAVVTKISDFGDRVLGKGIVDCKDTPNFIANRIGTYGMGATFKHMARMGMTVDEVDAIFGAAMGRPKSAVFRTADVVGLDTLKHVFDNLHAYLVDDEERDVFTLPDALHKLLADGRAGAKTGAGFYKKVKKGGKSEILTLDLETLQYVEKTKPRFASIGAARKAGSTEKGIQALCAGDDKAAELAWTVLADSLIYTANRIPEIADDIVNVDRALCWGFGWELGPFQTWDALGVRASVARMEGEGRTVPQWVKDMLASGRESFYARGEDGSQNYAVTTGGAAPVSVPEGVLFLADLKAKSKPISRNPSASLHDLGDGVLGLEFHSKMNALDELIFDQYDSALDKLDAGEFDALVVGNQDRRAFCAGANVLMILMGAMQKQWDSIDNQLIRLQKLMMRAKYSKHPVVTAPFGLTLGGGLEVAMHSTATVATGELYCGLVEVGVGLIPGAGGCKELLVRLMGDVPQGINYDPMPYVQHAFEAIGMAKTSTSAEEARSLGYLRHGDPISMNIDRQLGDAKRLAMGLAAGGYTPGRPRTIKVPGRSGLAAVEMVLYSMRESGYATEHDVTVGKALGHVLTGGDVPTGSTRTEQDLLDLEREAFLSLCGNEKSQARMQHMLQTGKPLRN